MPRTPEGQDVSFSAIGKRWLRRVPWLAYIVLLIVGFRSGYTALRDKLGAFDASMAGGPVQRISGPPQVVAGEVGRISTNMRDSQLLEIDRAGTVAMVASWRGLSLVDLARMTERAVLKEDFAGITCIAVSPDGRYGASASRTQHQVTATQPARTGANLWDLTAGKLQSQLLIDNNPIMLMRFSADGRSLYAAYENGVIAGWAVPSGKLEHKLDPRQSGGRIPVGFVIAMGDGRYVIRTERPGKLALSIRDILTGEEIFSAPPYGDDGRARNMSFSDDLEQATCLTDSRGLFGVQVRNLRSDKPVGMLMLASFLPREDSVSNPFLSADGRFAFAHGSSCLAGWDAATGKALGVLRQAMNGNTSVFWNGRLRPLPDGRILGVGYGGMHILNPPTDAFEGIITLPDRTNIAEFKFIRGGDAMLVVSFPALTVRQIDSANGGVLSQYFPATKADGQPNPYDQITACCTADGRKVVVYGNTNVQVGNAMQAQAIGPFAIDVQKNEVRTMYEVYVPSSTYGYGAACACSADGVYSIVGDMNNAFLGMSGQAHGTRIVDHNNYSGLQCAAFSPDGKHFALARSNGLYYYQSDGPKLLRESPFNLGPRSLVFSPDGARLAVGTAAGGIAIMDVATWREAMRLDGHCGEVISVAFSPDGKWLASSAGDGTVRLWDLAGCRQYGRYAIGGVSRVAFSPRGRLAVAGPGFVQFITVPKQTGTTSAASRTTQP